MYLARATFINFYNEIITFPREKQLKSGQPKSSLSSKPAHTICRQTAWSFFQERFWSWSVIIFCYPINGNNIHHPGSHVWGNLQKTTGHISSWLSKLHAISRCGSKDGLGFLCCWFAPRNARRSWSEQNRTRIPNYCMESCPLSLGIKMFFNRNNWDNNIPVNII